MNRLIHRSLVIAGVAALTFAVPALAQNQPGYAPPPVSPKSSATPLMTPGAQSSQPDQNRDQGAAPPPAADSGASGSMPSSAAGPSGTGRSQAQMVKPAPRKPVTMAHRMSCYDYAWQSQDMQNCLARHPEQTGQVQGGGQPMMVPAQH